jgi:hypothetical protein
MKMMRGLLVLLAACGFASQTDGASTDSDEDGIVDDDDNCRRVANPAQHDWDGDDHGDDCDGCPHVAAEADLDDDNDGVGNDCDPRRTIAGDAREIWLGFYAPEDITGWMQSRGDGTWSVDGGMLHQTNAASIFSLLDSPMPYADAYFATSVELVTANPPEVGFCLGDIQAPPAAQYYCCGVHGPATARAISAWPGGAGIDESPWSGEHGAGNRVDMTGTLAGATFSCELVQGIARATRATMTGGKLGTAVFYTAGRARYRYLFVATIGT